MEYGDRRTENVFWQVLRDELDMDVPPVGKYAVGMVFLPTIERRREESKKVFNKVICTFVVTIGLTLSIYLGQTLCCVIFAG
jgi:glutamate synthase domain-containing protein 1